MKNKEKEVEKKHNKKIKEGFHKFWYLLWQDDSFKGWIFSLIFLFLLVQYIIFPSLRLVTGTSLPLAIVETCSMYHQGNFFSTFQGWFDSNKEEKYLRYNITKEEFEKFPLNRGFSKGDIIFMVKANLNKLQVGDIIAFDAGTKSTPIVHRIIKIREEDGKRIFTTMGDNNQEILKPNNNLWNIDEESIKEKQILGKVLFRIAPEIGWVKLIFFEPSKPISERGLCREN
jgi:signal peptidase I